jgi:prophage regulatory protein
MSTTAPLRVIRLPEVLEKTGLGRTTIWRMEAAGTFPQSVSLGGKAVGWIEAEIDTWIEACMAARQSRPEASTSPR